MLCSRLRLGIPLTLHDIYSRKIVGWSMSNWLQTKLVNNALLMTIKRKKPNKSLICHVEREGQYASYKHKALLKKYNIAQSRSRKGNCWEMV